MLGSLHGKVINFHGTVLGFRNLNHFRLDAVDGDSWHAFLQATEEDNVGFFVVSPFVYFPEYSFEITETDKKELAVESQEDVLVLGIVSLREPYYESTMNLLAPLVINIERLTGKQIVLPSKYSYDTRTTFVKESVGESGGF